MAAANKMMSMIDLDAFDHACGAKSGSNSRVSSDPSIKIEIVKSKKR